MNSKTLAGVQAQLDAPITPEPTEYRVVVKAKGNRGWSHAPKLTREACDVIIAEELEDPSVIEVRVVREINGRTITDRYIK